MNDVKLLQDAQKHESLEKQLGAEDFIISPSFAIEDLPEELMQICGRGFRDSLRFDYLVLPKWLVRNEDIEPMPDHIIYMREKSNSSGRFIPNFGARCSGENYDDMLKNKGFAGYVIESDITDEDFFNKHMLKILRGDFGDNYHLIPAQIAMIGNPVQFKKKSYILYHNRLDNLNKNTYVGIDKEGRNIPLEYSSINP